MTAMDWRQYDSAIGRFVSIDYMAEFMPEFTPYHFGYNSPVEFNDPTGLCPECLNDVKEPTAGQSYTDSKGTVHIYTPNQDGNGGTWVGQIENVVITGTTTKNTESVGQPGAMEGAIPVWGSTRASIDHFQNGNYWRGTAYAALAVSDLFLVKSLVTGGVKLGVGLFAKSSTGLADDVAVKGGNVVYHSVEGGVTTYVGITNNVARRAAEHLSKKGISITPLMKNLSRSDAKAVEQALIEIHGLSKNGGTLINKINSISTKNPTFAKQLERGYELLKTIGY